MERSRATAFFRGRAGTTLAELMVAVAIMSIGCLGLFGAFTYIRSPGGVLFEPESGLHGSKERFERWYTGGSLF